MAATAQTGVGAIFCASHRDHLTGQLHGHSYEVTAWWSGDDRDARVLQAKLTLTLAAFDHLVIEETPWAEQIAAKLCQLLGCVEVEVRRPLERIYARART